MNEHELLQRAVDGELDESGRRALAALLATRPDLVRELEEIRSFKGLWTTAVRPAENSGDAEDLARRLWPRRRGRRRPRRAAWLLPAAAVAATLILLLLPPPSSGLLPRGWHGCTPVRTPAELAAPRGSGSTTLDLGSFHGEAGPTRGD